MYFKFENSIFPLKIVTDLKHAFCPLVKLVIYRLLSARRCPRAVTGLSLYRVVVRRGKLGRRKFDNKSVNGRSKCISEDDAAMDFAPARSLSSFEEHPGADASVSTF